MIFHLEVHTHEKWLQLLVAGRIDKICLGWKSDTIDRYLEYLDTHEKWLQPLVAGRTDKICLGWKLDTIDRYFCQFYLLPSLINA